MHQNDDQDEEIFQNEIYYRSNSHRMSRHKQIKKKDHYENRRPKFGVEAIYRSRRSAAAMSFEVALLLLLDN